MSLWFILSLMTVAAVFAVLWPLSRRPAAVRSGNDLAVYRDQLEEVARDRALGRIGEAEAEAARIEVSRRLLAAADMPAAEAAGGETPVRRRRMVALAAMIVLPLGALFLYLALGSPMLPGEPYALRRNPPQEQRSLPSLVAQVEAHLEKNPDDGQGWEVIAPVYLRLGRFNDAVKARSNALRILGPDAERESDLGEALAAAANGIVTADARAAFERAVKLDPQEFKARYFLGLAAEQDGQREAAAEIWRKLLAEAPSDAAWKAQVQESIARVVGTAAPGPSAEDIKAAESLTPDQRSEMIRGMVAGLAERLKSEGSDVEGWLRLLRAYMVLGDRDRAKAAAADARRALEGDAEKTRRLEAFIKEIGLDG